MLLSFLVIEKGMGSYRLRSFPKSLSRAMAKRHDISHHSVDRIQLRDNFGWNQRGLVADCGCEKEGELGIDSLMTWVSGKMNRPQMRKEASKKKQVCGRGSFCGGLPWSYRGAVL